MNTAASGQFGMEVHQRAALKIAVHRVFDSLQGVVSDLKFLGARTLQSQRVVERLLQRFEEFETPHRPHRVGGELPVLQVLVGQQGDQRLGEPGVAKHADPREIYIGKLQQQGAIER